MCTGFYVLTESSIHDFFVNDMVQLVIETPGGLLRVFSAVSFQFSKLTVS